jgi:hypothetical protein
MPVSARIIGSANTMYLITVVTVSNFLTTFIKLEDEQEIVIKTFHDFFVVWQLLATGKLRPRYVAIGGLLNLSEEDRAEYLMATYGYLDYADYLLLVDIGPRYETQKMEKYCVESIYV